jgi:hypothetical protein
MWSRGIAGVVLCAVGIIFVLQGTNVLHGSGMSGEGKWAIVGAVIIAVGLASLVWAAVRRRGESAEPG